MKTSDLTNLSRRLRVRKISIIKKVTPVNTKQLKGLALGLALCFVSGKQMAVAAPSPDMEPEIITSSWSDDSNRFACVTLNGKELFRFKAATSRNKIAETAIEEKAEDLAAKLDQLVKNKKFDADKLYPVRNKDGIVLKIDNQDLFKLSCSELANASVLGQPLTIDSKESDSKSLEAKSLEYGLRLTNVIRTAFGVKTLPSSFLKLAELTARHSLNDLTAIAKATGHFSGNASWYGPHFHGHKTSDGTIFDQDGLTAAHRSLPFGTKLLVMNRKTGASCVVKVNDRGPFIDGRIIDLSKGAARQLNMLGSGVAIVDCIVLGRE